MEPGSGVVEPARQATLTLIVPGPDGEDQAIGAGFVHLGTGLIVTNAHVVAGQETIKVGTIDGRIATGRVVGSDPVNDIALVETALPNVPGLAFAETPARVGDTVYAIGSPFGLGQTVTRGIVSALDRAIDATTPFGMVQHDAPLNPGSSGGPVIDESGRVIGINTAMPDGFRRDVGIAYAIPADVAKGVVERLARGDATPIRKLGVTLRALTPRVAAAVGVATEIGVLVESVQAGSPAEAAGIVPSDVIAKIEDHPIRKLRDVAIAIDQADLGARLSFELYRGVERFSVTVPPAPAEPAASSEPDSKARRQWVEAASLGFTLAPEKATILAIDRGSPAATAGIESGDTILAVGRTKVSTALQTWRLIGPVVTEPFALLLADKDGATRYVVVDPWAGGLDGDSLSGNMRHPRSASF